MPRFFISKTESEESEKARDLSSHDKSEQANAIIGQFTDLIFDMWLEYKKKKE
jgi:hypothetical protein